ncbi:hypothetical protein FRB93_011048 [Tulasnella sp. JGI-2019a]|nr:hypothetical protein FRB93_011048 [Tulasnella sp. JGI-2019a]
MGDPSNSYSSFIAIDTSPDVIPTIALTDFNRVRAPNATTRASLNYHEGKVRRLHLAVHLVMLPVRLGFLGQEMLGIILRNGLGLGYNCGGGKDTQALPDGGPF